MPSVIPPSDDRVAAWRTSVEEARPEAALVCASTQSAIVPIVNVPEAL